MKKILLLLLFTAVSLLFAVKNTTQILAASDPTCSLDCSGESLISPGSSDAGAVWPSPQYAHTASCDYSGTMGSGGTSISCTLDGTSLSSCIGTSTLTFTSFGPGKTADFSATQNPNGSCSTTSNSFCIRDWHPVGVGNWMACGYDPYPPNATVACGHSFPYQFLQWEDYCGGTDYQKRYCQQPACAEIVSCTETSPFGRGNATCAVTAESGADGSGTVKTFDSCTLTWDTDDISGEGQTSVLSSNCNKPNVSKPASYNPYGGEHTISYKVVQPPSYTETTAATTVLCTTSYPAIPVLSEPIHKKVLKTKSINLQWDLPTPADSSKYGHNNGWGYGDIDAADRCQTDNNFEVYLYEGNENYDSSITAADVYDGSNKIENRWTGEIKSIDPSSLKWGYWYYWGIIAKNGTFASNNIPDAFTTDNKRPIRAFKVDWPDSWYITYTGDVHGQDGITSVRPAPDDTPLVCDTTDYPAFFSNLNITQGDVSSGLITHGHGGSYDSGCMGDTEIVGLRPPLQHGYGGLDINQSKQRYNFDYFADLISDKTDVNAIPNNPDEVYLITGSISADGNINVAANKKAVIFVSGNLTFGEHAKVKVNNKGFLAFIVGGEIKFDPKIEGSKDDPAIEGIYIAQTIRTGSKNLTAPGVRFTESQLCSAVNLNDYRDKTFFAGGIFVAWDTISLERNLEPKCIDGSGKVERQGNENIKTPGEVFYYRPELLLYAPEEIKLKKLYWEEIAP